MTTAQNMKIYNGFAGSPVSAKPEGLKERIQNYFYENRLLFASAMATMSGSSYAFFKYVLPELKK